MRSNPRVLLTSILAVVATISPSASTAEGAEPRPLDPFDFWRERRSAQADLDAGLPAEAVARLERLLPVAADDGRLWLQLAEARLKLGRGIDAAAALTRVRELGFLEPAVSAYRLAQAHAAAGDVERAVAWLETSLAEGYRFRHRIAADPHFASLRDDRRFQRLAGGAGAAEPADRDGAWRADLDHLESELRRLHYHYRRLPLPDRYRAQASRLRAAIPTWSDSRIVVEIQRLLATLDDGHTLAWPFGMRRGQLERIPLGLWLFADGLYVVRARDRHRDLVGQRVESIGGVETAALLAALRPSISHDNPSGYRWVAPAYLTFVDFLEAAGGRAEDGRVLVGLRDAAEALTEVAIAHEPADPSEIPLGLIAPPAIAPEDLPLYLQRLDTPFWSTTLADDVLYVQVNRVADGPRRTLAAFAHELRERITAGEPRALVLDLRHNNGGEAGLLAELVRTLVHFDTSRPDGSLVVLISRNTFSAAQTLLNLTERLTSALFVGEPAGTRPNRLGNEAPFELPFSGVRGTISSGYNQAASSRDHRLWIPPDVPVALDSRAYFSGRDPVLEVALELRPR